MIHTSVINYVPFTVVEFIQPINITVIIIPIIKNVRGMSSRIYVMILRVFRLSRIHLDTWIDDAYHTRYIIVIVYLSALGQNSIYYVYECLRLKGITSDYWDWLWDRAGMTFCQMSFDRYVRLSFPASHIHLRQMVAGELTMWCSTNNVAQSDGREEQQ